MTKMKYDFFLLILLAIFLSCATQNDTTEKEIISLSEEVQTNIWNNTWGAEQQWFASFRDAVYGQLLTSNDMHSLYVTAKNNAEDITNEVERLIMLARCENLMGQVYQREGQKKKAISHYTSGKYYSKLAIEIYSVSETWYVLSESIYLLCHAHGFFYKMCHGFSFNHAMNKTVKLNPDNPAGLYLLAKSIAFADPFENYPKAQKQLESLLDKYEYLPKDILFNTYYLLGYIHKKQKNTEKAHIWFENALKIYPTNKDVQDWIVEI